MYAYIYHTQSEAVRHYFDFNSIYDASTMRMLSTNNIKMYREPSHLRMHARIARIILSFYAFTHTLTHIQHTTTPYALKFASMMLTSTQRIHSERMLHVQRDIELYT